MNQIAVPTSPETRTALEKADWHFLDYAAPGEAWRHPAGFDIIIEPGEAPHIAAIQEEAPLGIFLEFAAILGIAPPGYRLIPEEIATQAIPILRRDIDSTGNVEVWAAAGERLGSYPPGTADTWTAERNTLQALVAALTGPGNESSIQEQATTIQAERGPVVPGIEADRGPGWPSSDPAPPRPQPSEEGGSSPSEMAEPTDEQLRRYSEITRREPGFHQVNPINQRKAAALHPDGQALLNMVQTSLASYDTPRITAELKAFFAEDDEAAEPQEEGTP